VDVAGSLRVRRNVFPRLLVNAGELGLGAAQQVGDEVGLTADVDVALVRAAAEALVQRGAVALLLGAVEHAHQDVVRAQDLALAVHAEPADTVIILHLLYIARYSKALYRIKHFFNE